MDLKQLLNMLQGVSGPNASGEYTAKCPAHQDRTASLTATVKASPKDGKEKIYLCCHAGCTGSDIMAALGISAKDLIVNPDPAAPGGRSGNGSGKRSGAGRKTAGGDPSPAAQDDTRGTKGGSGKTETVGGVTVHTVPEEAKKDELAPDWEHPDRIYSYTDENGREIFQVVRLH